MIPRYDRSEISDLWNDEAKFKTYLEVELAILKALEGDKIPSGVSDQIKEKAVINPARIDEIERETRHDVIAFCTSITENLSPEEGKFFHFGVTSSDIIDTSLSLQIKRSMEVVRPVFLELLESIKNRALEMKDVLTIGRSHGMYAEPMSFGQKLLGHYAEFKRRFEDFDNFLQEDLTIQFSGAVGNYTILTPEHERKAAKNLGLKVEEVSTQVIPRDRIAKLVQINSLTGCAIERLAVEIRHLHRSDVSELHEGFKKGQKGSSTMPHKKNPISGENLTGMARMLKSHVSIAHENIVLWHERDISHSSAERMYLPDNFGVLFYALQRLKDTVEHLVFHPEVIEARTKENFNYLSSFYLHQLIEQTNIKREELYYFVQEAAFKANETKNPEDFQKTLVEKMDELGEKVDLPVPSFEQIKKMFTGHVEEVFKRTIKN